MYGASHQAVYQILPDMKLIHKFLTHQKIKKISSGLEHVVTLNSNGDVWSFGCGLRGQLGHGDVRSHEQPILVEALAGVKIVDISCGNFHTMVVSSFGDVYSFGWNTNGQLGLKKAAQGTLGNLRQGTKCQQVFTLPQLIDFEEEMSIVRVYCGNRHTFLRTTSNRLLAAGSNSYGQLGLSTEKKEEDTFKEIVVIIEEIEEIVCGFNSTYII